MNPTVIFDVDGVLIDSYHHHLQSWFQLAQEHAIVFTEDDFVATFGQTSRDTLRRYWPDDLDDDTIQLLDDRKEALFRKLVDRRCPVMPGATALIDALAGAGFLLAAGSSGPSENVALALDHVDPRGHVRARVTGEDVTRGKPDPQVFQLAAERVGAQPQWCVVIEDAPAGIAAARAAGMKCVGFTSTGRTADDLSDADEIVNALSDLTPARLRAVITAVPGA